MTCHSTLPRPDRRKAAGLAVVPPPVGHGTQRRRGDPPTLLLRLARFLLETRPALAANAPELIGAALIAAGVLIAFLTGEPP